MAGAVLAPGLQMTRPGEDTQFQTETLINNGDIINEGDLVGCVVVSSVGYITPASKTTGAIVKAIGVAFFPGNNSTNNTRTGDGTTMKCAIARKAIITGVTSTMVPGLGPGKPVYLGPVDTASVSNYTCTLTSTNGDAVQQVGWVSLDGLSLEIWVTNAGQQYQTSGNSTVNFA